MTDKIESFSYSDYGYPDGYQPIPLNHPPMGTRSCSPCSSPRMVCYEMKDSRGCGPMKLYMGNYCSGSTCYDPNREYNPQLQAPQGFQGDQRFYFPVLLDPQGQFLVYHHRIQENSNLLPKEATPYKP